jgi:hypothetical protein
MPRRQPHPLWMNGADQYPRNTCQNDGLEPPCAQILAHRLVIVVSQLSRALRVNPPVQAGSICCDARQDPLFHAATAHRPRPPQPGPRRCTAPRPARGARKHCPGRPHRGPPGQASPGGGDAWFSRPDPPARVSQVKPRTNHGQDPLPLGVMVMAPLSPELSRTEGPRPRFAAAFACILQKGHGVLGLSGRAAPSRGTRPGWPSAADSLATPWLLSTVT